MTIRLTPRRTARPVEFHLGSTSLGRADGDFEATLVVTPGGETRVRLTQLAWGAGVGWYAQHTLELSVQEARQIAALLNRAPTGSQAALDQVLESAGEPAAARSPISLAEARACRAARTTQSAPGPTGCTGQGSAPISGRDRAAPLSEGSAIG